MDLVRTGGGCIECTRRSGSCLASACFWRSASSSGGEIVMGGISKLSVVGRLDRDDEVSGSGSESPVVKRKLISVSELE